MNGDASKKIKANGNVEYGEFGFSDPFNDEPTYVCALQNGKKAPIAGMLFELAARSRILWGNLFPPSLSRIQCTICIFKIRTIV